MKAVQILSGGMDSATLAYHLRAKASCELLLLTFDYGQRHSRELVSAIDIAGALNAKHLVVDVREAGSLLRGSALTGDLPVPHGHYAEDNMRQTVVPNRNAIMLSLAWGTAVAEGADLVAYAAHAGDHFIYPDCRPAFVAALNEALRLGNEGHASSDLFLYAPFINDSKGRIVEIGLALGVPFELTWSCYEGGEVHCGKCGACNERLEAFAHAGAVDPVQYAEAV